MVGGVRTIALVLMLAPCAARADSPLVASAGIGVGVGSLRSDDLQPAKRPGAAVIVDVGYRVHATTAIGLHLGAGHYFRYDAYGSIAEPNKGIGYTPLQVGISAQFTLADQFWFTPWFGVEDGALDTMYGRGLSYRGLAFGLTAGFDLLRDRERRLSVLLAVSRTHDGTNMFASQNFIAGVVGAGYRFW